MAMLKGSRGGEKRCEVFQTAIFKDASHVMTLVWMCGYTQGSWILCNSLLCSGAEGTQQWADRGGGIAILYRKGILNLHAGIMATTYQNRPDSPDLRYQ